MYFFNELSILKIGNFLALISSIRFHIQDLNFVIFKDKVVGVRLHRVSKRSVHATQSRGSGGSPF